MTEVEIETAEDFQGDAVSTPREKDRILQTLAAQGDERDVYRAEAWLWEDKGLACLPKSETLVAARVVAETEKAWLLSQNEETEDPDSQDAETDWVPKSVARRYVAAENGVDADSSSQAFLDGWSA
jgi:hypothetical protein